MTLQEELVFRVPDISLYPRFSLDRHKPQSRLHNFHSLDYDEEIFIDLSYCDKSFSKVFNPSNQGLLNPNSLGVTLTDFSSLIANRKGSTSTPFRPKTPAGTNKQSDVFKDNQVDSLLFRPRLVSLSEDSGFIESSVAHTFAQSCVITSPVSIHRNKRPREENVNCNLLTCGVNNDDFSSEPLPCLSLEKRFDDLKSDSDNSNDSSDVSFVGKLEIESTQYNAGGNDVLYDHSSHSVVSLHKCISSASSGYGSLASQSSNLDIDLLSQSTASHDIEIRSRELEQVVPVIQHAKICDVKLRNETLEPVVENADAILPDNTKLSKACIIQPTISQRVAKVLQKVSPKDPERLIGRKIGLDQVDIIGELRSRNMLPALTVLFGHVRDSDLCTIYRVSRAWADAVSADVKANDRRVRRRNAASLPCNITEKENHALGGHAAKEVAMHPLTGVRTDGPLNTLQPVATPVRRTEPRTPTKPWSKYQQFVQAASSLKVGETLRKCPKCADPSRVDQEQERARCMNARCSYDFCIKCRSPFHGSRDCAASVSKKSRTERAKIGSKKSKQALKRL